MFSSILDPRVRAAVAAEILRVVRPSGMVLWYDMRVRNPGNRDVRGISAKEVRRLFPGATVHVQSATLAPPLVRAIAPYSWLLCSLLGQLPFARTPPLRRDPAAPLVARTVPGAAVACRLHSAGDRVPRHRGTTTRSDLRLAVFTNEFPSQTSSFFARDIRGLIEAGVDVHVFPFYSPTPSLWSAVPTLLDERVFPRDRIHYVPLTAAARLPKRSELGRLPVAVREALAVTGSALRFGAEAPVKSAYVALKAWAWAQRFPAGSFDHVLSYWGNYSATAAYLYHLLTDPGVPFSMFAHARMDLYEKQTYLAQKMTYADNLFLVCEYNRGYVRDLYPAAWPRLVEKIQIHHLGLDLEEFAFTPTGRAGCRIVTVGRLERLKGVHCLLAAVALLRERGVTPEVEIVGGGEESEALADQARELGLEDRVIFRGGCRRMR